MPSLVVPLLPITLDGGNHEVSGAKTEASNDDDNNDDDQGKAKNKEKNKKDGRLTTAEHRAEGTVKLGVIKAYFVAGGGTPIFALMILLYCIEKVLDLGKTLWLATWSADGIAGFSAIGYVTVFASISVTMLLFSLAANLLTAHVGLNAGIALHDKMLRRMVHAPMAFFDSTPLGRIQNRFSADTAEADNATQFALALALATLFDIIGTLFMVGWKTPYTLLVFVPIMAIFYFVQSYFRHSSRELKRLVALSRSPVFSHFAETLSGMSTIRAFGAEERVFSQAASRVNIMIRTAAMFSQSQFWLDIRLNFLGMLCLFAAGMTTVINRNIISAQDAGLSLTYALTVTQSLTMLVNFFQQLENAFNAIERLMEYGELDIEKDIEKVRVSPEWPREPRLEFKDLHFSYRKDLAPVLKGISARIEPGHRIGLCGRTWLRQVHAGDFCALSHRRA